MQVPTAAANCVIDAFARLGASEAETVKRHYAGMLSRKPPSENEKAKLGADAADALKLVDGRREALLQVLAPAEYRRVRQCAVVVVQGSLLIVSAGTEYGNVRDRAMAENVKWLAEEAFPDEKIVLWAHNGHISADPSAPGFVSMGQHLRQAFGEQMRVLGFAFERGEVYAIPFKGGKFDPGGPLVMKVPAVRPNSADALLRATGLPRLILDLRAVPAGSSLGTWMAEPQSLRSFGWAYDLDNAATAYSTVVLLKAFDALIFIEESTPTVLLK
jgi:erythromycin esterase